MTTGSLIGMSSVKPCCRILISCRSSSIFGSHLIIDCPSYASRPGPNHRRRYDYCTQKIVGHRCSNDADRRAFCSSGCNGNHVKVFRSFYGSGNVSSERSSIITHVASDVMNHSTSTASSSSEAQVDEKRLERFYLHGGLNVNVNVKPLVIEGIEDYTELGVEQIENSIGVNTNDIQELGNSETSPSKRKLSAIEEEAWKLLRSAVVNYCGKPIGTVAANDTADKHQLNYDQVFVRDFIPSAIAFLLNGEGNIVKNFLLQTLQLQSWEKTVDCYSPGQGLMPASFKVRTVPLDGKEGSFEEVLDPNFGESAIGRVAPVDSGLWWIILLRAYGKITGDYSLQERVDIQTGIRMVLNLCLTNGFDMFPTLLVTDGSCMIDRRMGIHGHPLEIQALFYSALRCSREILIVNDTNKSLLAAINDRLSALSFHIREYYWVDMMKLNEIYCYKTEEYSSDAINKFNIYPEQIPSWLADWIPERGGYFIGNLQPAHMDFRFFTLGNLWSIVSSLGDHEQNKSILNLIDAKWDDLMADMPLKICYPALESEEWHVITGSDPKNTPWSYHNGGSWPTLLWQFTLACIKMGQPDLAKKAVTLAEKRLSLDQWPEYYDTKKGRFIGKQARLYQTWTLAGYLTSKMLLDNPEAASALTWDEDYELLKVCICALSKGGRRKCSRAAMRPEPAV